MGVLNTTPRTWIAGDLVDATTLNTEIRDPITAMQSAWTSYTPTVTGTVSNPSGWATQAGYYHRWGKTVMGKFYLVPAASGFTAGSGTYQIAAPVTANMGTANQSMVGEGYFFHNATTTMYVARVRLQANIGGGSGTGLILILTGTSYYVGTGGPVAPAASDQIGGCFRYEAV